MQLDHEAPAELHVGVVGALQPRSNVSVNIAKGQDPTIAPRYQPLARQITCESGYVVRSDHPPLADQITRDEIVALIEVVE